jgi:hypothetical protein
MSPAPQIIFCPRRPNPTVAFFAIVRSGIDHSEESTGMVQVSTQPPSKRIESKVKGGKHCSKPSADQAGEEGGE